MDTVLRTAAAAVTGARHVRALRNGQDAAVAFTEGATAVAVVCDGCSSGAGSEAGARLGAALFARALTERLATGVRPTDVSLWDAARADVGAAVATLLERMPGDRTRALHDHFLFTVVAAAAAGDQAAVWAIGDGAYWCGEHTRVLGPFEDNAPPYLAYDLLGDRREAQLAIVPPGWPAIVVATDGATELDGLEPFAAATYVDHPDALRRHLALLARPRERIDWSERRIVRTPASLQDDCAVAIIRRDAR